MLKYYTLEEISELIKIPIETIRQYLRSGKLVGSKIGRHWRVSEEQLKTFMEGNSNQK